MNASSQTHDLADITTPQLEVLPAHAPADPEPASSVAPADSTVLARASKPKTRNGKIARLPYLERDMVNRMLRNNIPHHNYLPRDP